MAGTPLRQKHERRVTTVVAPRIPASLYDPAFEHEACGLGFTCNVKGFHSHEKVKQGLKILENLTHRGACGCDATTGDGAGILLQMPHAFYEKDCIAGGMALPSQGAYGSGLVFLPSEHCQRRFCRGRLEEIVSKQGLVFLGWREVPVEKDALGRPGRHCHHRRGACRGGA